ncbi:MAG: cation:proton antiporter [Thermoanaerobaculia bacterium]
MTDPSPWSSPALGVAIALAVGMGAQALARHLRIPGIVLLLGAGVLLGPDLLGLIQPAALEGPLQTLVGYAVAVILFEGGLNLDLRRLRREAVAIRRLVTLGALVTAVGGTLAARWILQWDWTLSVLFGTLVIVTGPTVINPLLRRIRVQRNLSTVLEAEGVLVDAVGAIVAVVALEVALSPSGESAALGAWHLVSRLGSGALLGLGAGLLLALLLRFENLVPEGLENVFTLSLVLLLFQGSNVFLEESGIVAVTVAGLVVGNVKTRALGDLKEFKEQLTVLLIGMLFVLLAADVRLAEVRALGWPGAWTVLALMLVVRPLNVLVGTSGSDLELREKAFLAWLAPRGIVAAAVSSLCAQELEAAGFQGGSELRALVFLVIAATVLVQGLSGGWVAQLLGVRKLVNTGFVVLGANRLGLALGSILRSSGEEVIFIDSNPDACLAAEGDGFRVLFGSALSESILIRSGLDRRAGCVAMTANDEVNLVFAQRARRAFKVPRAWVALRRGHVSVTAKMVEAAGAQVLFGRPRRLDLWSLRLERGLASLERWQTDGASLNPSSSESFILPMAVARGQRVTPFDETGVARSDAACWLLIFQERREKALAWLQEQGWRPAP